MLVLAPRGAARRVPPLGDAASPASAAWKPPGGIATSVAPLCARDTRDGSARATVPRELARADVHLRVGVDDGERGGPAPPPPPPAPPAAAPRGRSAARRPSLCGREGRRAGPRRALRAGGRSPSRKTSSSGGRRPPWRRSLPGSTSPRGRRWARPGRSRQQHRNPTAAMRKVLMTRICRTSQRAVLGRDASPSHGLTRAATSRGRRQSSARARTTTTAEDAGRGA